MKRIILTLLLALNLVSCGTKLPSAGSKATVQSEHPQVVMVDQSLEKTKVLVRNSQDLIDKVSQLSSDNKALAEHLKTTDTNNPVVDKLIEGQIMMGKDLFQIKVELRDAYDELERNKANTATLQVKIDTQSKELKSRTDAYNIETDKVKTLTQDIIKEKIKTQEEKDRGDKLARRCWWFTGIITLFLILKGLKIWGKLSIPFI